MHLELNGIVPLTDILTTQGGPATVVAVLKSLPLSQIVLPFFAVLGFIFLATSLDSATYVLSAIATKELHGEEEPARWHRLVWGVVLSGISLALLAVGGLRVIQTSAVLVSVPMLVLYILLAVSLLRWLREDCEGVLPPVKPICVLPGENN